jgi:hypothetical protein
MQFRLFNAANNQTIQHFTYLITVTRGTSIVKKVIMLVSTMAADKTTIVFVPTKPLLTYFTTDGFGLRSVLINYPDNK